MVVTILLLYMIAIRYWNWPTTTALAVLTPFLLIDLVFLGSNTLKIPQGGWFPLALGAGLVTIIWIWTKGTRILTEKAARETVPLTDLIQMLERRPPNMVRGTAIFLTSTPGFAPIALLHNLKHNQVLHNHNIILTVATADVPRVSDSKRILHRNPQPAFRMRQCVLRLHGNARHSKCIGAWAAAWAEAQRDVDIVLPGPAVGCSLTRSNAVVAGLDLHLPHAERGQADRVL